MYENDEYSPLSLELSFSVTTPAQACNYPITESLGLIRMEQLQAIFMPEIMALIKQPSRIFAPACTTDATVQNGKDAQRRAQRYAE